MATDDSSRPPLLGSSEVLWLAGLGALVVLIATTEVVAAVVMAMSGLAWHWLALPAGARFAVDVVRHAGDPSLAFPRPRPHLGAAAFWLAEVLTLAGISIGASALWRAIRHGQRLGRDARGEANGFATRAEVQAVAGVDAARRLAPRTRPTLASDGHRTKLAPEQVGFALGTTKRPRGVALWANWEVSLRVVAPPAAGKTYRLLVPIILGAPGPALVTSVKRDIYEATVARRELLGPVFTLDPENLVPASRSIRWSPVVGCVDTRVAERRAVAFIAANGEMADMKSSGFFTQSAAALLAAYFHAAAHAGGSMIDVMAWQARPGDATPVAILARECRCGVDWGARIERHTTGAEETTSGVMRTLELSLACFQHRDVLELVSPPDGQEFDFVNFIAKKGTIYALGEDSRHASVGPLVTAFCEEVLYQAKKEAARRRTQRLDPPMLSVLDEVANIAPLPSLPSLLATGRGIGLPVVYSLQSFAQQVERWGPEAAKTMGDATAVTAVFGGLKDAGTLRDLSLLAGRRRVQRYSTSHNPGSSTMSVSEHGQDEDVITEAQISGLEEGNVLLFWRGLPPMTSYVKGTWERRDARELAAAEDAARSANALAASKAAASKTASSVGTGGGR